MSNSCCKLFDMNMNDSSNHILSDLAIFRQVDIETNK